MKPRIITSAIWALVITAISVVGSFPQIGFTSPATRHIAHLASLPAYPGAYVMAVLGLGHGPDGLPNQHDLLGYVVVTFLLWWGVVHGARLLWAQLRPPVRQAPKVVRRTRQ